MSLDEAMAGAGIALREAGAAIRERASLSGDLAEVREARKFSDAGAKILGRAARGAYSKQLVKEARARRFSGGTGVLVKSVDEDRFGLFVAYSPNRLPLRGADGKVDLASPRVLEKAAWRFALNGLKVGTDHRPGGEGAARVVENYVWRGAPWHVVGPDGTEEVVSEGDWLVGLLFTREAWADFKSGRWSGISLQGSATRKPATRKTLKRQGR